MNVLLEAIERATRDPAPAFWRVGIAGSLLAAAGALVAVPLLRSPRAADPPTFSARRAAANLSSGAPILNETNPPPPAIATPESSAPQPSAIPVAALAPPAESLFAPVPPRPSRPSSRHAAEPTATPRRSAGPAVSAGAPVVAASPPAKPDCNPNYYFDKNGKKHFKAECFE